MHNNQPKNQSVIIEIDNKSGFCFGVSRAVKMAEEQLKTDKELFSLGDIVHNEQEIDRLYSLGMQTIQDAGEKDLDHQTVLFRAHGEPPVTYQKMKRKGASVLDATCPVVLKLQARIKRAFSDLKEEDGQLVIYGKKGHAEVIGLTGQTNGEAIVVESSDDISLLDPCKKTVLFCQTTMSYAGLSEIEKQLRNYLRHSNDLEVHRTICAQVGNRVPHLQKFATRFELILFVSGAKSSNGRFLYETCREVNPRAYFVSQPSNIRDEWFESVPLSIGICGATSTPTWLMEEVAGEVKRRLSLM